MQNGIDIPLDGALEGKRLQDVPKWVPADGPQVWGLAEWITPERAKQILKTMPKNRAIAPRHVNKLATDIQGGNWHVSNQGIGISKYGELLDGEHRLLAIVQTGIAVHMLVVRGLEPTSRLSIDAGRSRSYASHRQITRDEGSSLHKASFIRLYATGQLSLERGVALRSITTTKAFSNYELDEWSDYVERFVDPAEAYNIGVRAKAICSPAAMSALFTAVSISYDREIALDFCSTLTSGAGLELGDPKLALRQSLERLRARSGTVSREKYYQTLRAGFALWAQNKERRAGINPKDSEPLAEF